MSELINEHDETKNMLNLIREFDSSIDMGNDTESVEDASEQDFEENKQSFMESVNPKTDFESLKVYRNERNVVFSGKFQNMGGMTWRMILNEDNGLYVDVQGLQISQEALQTLNKLFGYYKNWSDEWGEKLNQDYKQNAG